MLVIPSIDLADGRSRLVSWPRAAASVGVAAIILGEALLSGRVEYPAAREAAA